MATLISHIACNRNANALGRRSRNGSRIVFLSPRPSSRLVRWEQRALPLPQWLDGQQMACAEMRAEPPNRTRGKWWRLKQNTAAAQRRISDSEIAGGENLRIETLAERRLDDDALRIDSERLTCKHVGTPSVES
jgi:hypothetical protein